MELAFDPSKPKYEYVTDLDHANRAFEMLEKDKVVGLDTETTSLDPHNGTLLLVQIGNKDTSYIFDARKVDLKNFPRAKAFLEDSKIIKILHNAKFDYKYIKVHLEIELANIYDTMLSEAVLNSGIGSGFYSLKEIAFKYTGIKMDKQIRESFIDAHTRTITEDQLAYSAIDTHILFPIFEQQLEKLQKEGIANIAKLEFAATRAVGDIELKGIYINKEKWAGIIDQLKIKRDELARQFQEAIRPYYHMSAYDLFGNAADSINMNSQQQLMDLLNNKLKLNLPSTGDALLASTNHPIVKILRDYRGYEKLISAFGDSLLAKINPKTGRIHPEFNQMGTATGRFSCNNPNLQQIPRNSEQAPFRTCFNPQPGYKLVVADYSNFEMRILADLSGDEKMIGALNGGLDIHSYTAALMFDKEYSSDFKKKYPELRQLAKPIGFGLMYGMGAMGLSKRLETETGKPVTKEESEDLIKRYFAAYPGVKVFLERIGKEAVRKGFSKTPAGRKRWYHKVESNDPDYRKKISQIEREAKNHPIQGTNADAIKFALVFLKERLKKDNIDGAMILTVHDEIVSEIREDQAEQWAKIQVEEMIRAGKLFLKRVSITSDPFIGTVWEH